eukprot:m.524555 g.524555  ORF g.524555 m.524555 type:complete len:930 (+) comp21989_c0_seq4:241-3030(+)
MLFTLHSTLAVLCCMHFLATAEELDWLVQTKSTPSTVTPRGSGITLTNGLITREFVTTPAFGTIDFTRTATLARGAEQSLFRSVHPESMITLNGTQFAVGGLQQKSQFLAYCNRSDITYSADPSAFQYKSHTVSDPVAPFPWVPGTRHSPVELSWPPKGKRLSVVFAPPAQYPQFHDVQVTLHYEIYDGIPLIAKSMDITMASSNKTAPKRATATVQGWVGSAPDVVGVTTDVGVVMHARGVMQSDGAVFNHTASLSVEGVFSTPSGVGGQEIQSSITLIDNAMLLLNREQAVIYASCDEGSLYYAVRGVSKPVDLGPCTGLIRIEVAPNGTSAQITSSGRVLVKLAGPFPTTLYPQLFILQSGYSITHIAPFTGPLPVPRTVRVDSATVELFGAMPRFGEYLTHGSHAPGNGNVGAAAGRAPNPLLDARTDQAHGAACVWLDDFPNSAAGTVPGCSTCRDEGAVEPYLNCSYTLGPGAYIDGDTGEAFTSFRSFLLVHDSTDVERQALGHHRATQILAPHVMENPVFFHATDVSLEGFKETIDQMALVGFEMLVFSFGTGFNLENANALYLDKIKAQVAYAKSKGIEVGGYDLICLDRGGPAFPQWTAHGAAAGDLCFASGWYDHLHGLVLDFINATGLSMLETDGPYGGESCTATTHSHHHGEVDSVYRQTQLQNTFYKEMRQLGVFINQPDDYFFQGGQKTGMGYDEQQYSLPRWRDLSISRMGMYDDMYLHLPTQGWMFVPVSDYHAGGEAAEFGQDPAAYEFALAQYLGAGVAACYRGPRPFASPATQTALTKWITFYKTHRHVLTQPIVHVRRADMQSWDGWLHVNPLAWGTQARRTAGGCVGLCRGSEPVPEVGAAVFFNPTDTAIATNVSIPLYYTGLTTTAHISVNEGPQTSLPLARDFSISVHLVMPPRSVHTVVIGGN